jgi:hypothetical protein
MTGRRVALLATCAVVLALGVTFVFVSVDTGNRIVTIVAAVAAVAAVGVAVWAALPGRRHGGLAVAVRGTGKATAGPNGVANTGFIGSTGSTIEVQDTGDASGGDANTGVRLD